MASPSRAEASLFNDGSGDLAARPQELFVLAMFTAQILRPPSGPIGVLRRLGSCINAFHFLAREVAFDHLLERFADQPGSEDPARRRRLGPLDLNHPKVTNGNVDPSNLQSVFVDEAAVPKRLAAVAN